MIGFLATILITKAIQVMGLIDKFLIFAEYKTKQLADGFEELSDKL